MAIGSAVLYYSQATYAFSAGIKNRHCTCIDAQETGWQSGVRLYVMPRLPTHIVQELNVDTVHVALGPLV